MALSFPRLPFIYSYSATTQLEVLAALLLISYLNKTLRYIIAGLICLYFGAKIAKPLAGWLWFIFKGIAWIGFYMRFFLIGVEYLYATYQSVVYDWLAGFLRELDEADERRKEEERAEKAQKEREEREQGEEQTQDEEPEKEHGKKGRRSKRR